MKKIISVLLLVAMCLSLFAACGKNEVDTTGLENAKKFVHSSYIANSATTSVDYKVMGVAKVDGVEYKVEWTANSDKITFTRGEDKFVTVHVPNDNLEDIKYTLTGTISDAAGNTATVTFERVVPARAGVPTTVTTGTYVITWENLTFSSLTADKNYGYAPFNTVTVADGVVSGHFKADVLTLTAVDGGFTIQDAHGRYVYLKGTYNSFNVGAEAPEEGHIWQLLTGKDGSIIVNKMNGKTLCYDSAYSSWGAYDEVTEARKSQVTLTAATAPEVDPETPDQPGTPDTPAQPSGEITTPVAGTAYKLGLYQGNKGTMLYFIGQPKAGYDWYMLSSQNVADAVDVFVEEVDGGLRLYFTIDGTKTYLDMYKNGEHYSLRLTTEPTAVYTLNTEHKTFVATLEDKECYIGTYNTYDTFSCNKMDGIATSFVAHLYPQTGATVPSEPETPSDSTGEVTTPVAGTAYKLGMFQGNKNTMLYFTGVSKPNYAWYMLSTTNVAEAIDVFVEEVDGGLRLYFTIDGTKTYLDMHKDGTHYSLRLTTEPTAVYTWNAELNTFVTTVEDKECVIGTSGTYDTFSCNTMDKIDSTFVAHLYGQGGAETPDKPETPDQPEKPADPAEVVIADGSYLLIVDGKGMTALAADKNYGYMPTVDITVVAEGGYTDNEIIVIKNVAGGFTMQDVYGRYIYMSGTYNNFNVSATVPAEGHIWTATATEGGFIITNVLKGKNLVYGDGGYTTFGAYADKSSVVSVIAVTGNSTPEQPNQPETPDEPESNANAVITFDDAANRTVMTATQQVWVANGITVTNDQAASTSEIKDYVAPVRFYAHTSVTIAYAGMKTIKITCNSASYATALVDSIPAAEGVTVTVEENVVTITFAAAVDSFVVADLAKQVRVDKIEIFK